jgi:nucleoside 2-deoxyribosyltransferase
MKAKIYLAGPLFSQAERDWAKKLKALVEATFPQVQVLWPHEFPAEGENIFAVNLENLEKCQLMIAVLDGPQVDDGTAWEMGYHYARGREILGIRTDFRRAGERDRSIVNAMIQGCCLCIVDSPDQLLARLERFLALPV